MDFVFSPKGRKGFAISRPGEQAPAIEARLRFLDLASLRSLKPFSILTSPTFAVLSLRSLSICLHHSSSFVPSQVVLSSNWWIIQSHINVSSRELTSVPTEDTTEDTGPVEPTNGGKPGENAGKMEMLILEDLSFAD